MSDVRAIALSIAVAIAIVMCVQSTLPRSAPAPCGRWIGGAAGAAVLLLCVWVVPRWLLLADWGATLQKLVVLVAWTASAAIVAGLPAVRAKRRALAAGVCALLIGVAAVAAAPTRTLPASDAPRPVDLSLAIDRYATFDTSFTVLLDLVRPMLSDGEFFSELRRTGDATDDRSLKAVALRVADPSQTPAPHRPHIFVVVVDSLRPDYVSAYNPAVTFTPAMGAFARESIVMRRAYTPYAGTALSQPALWAGGLIQRAMYVKPFSAVNNLEGLLTAGGYRRYLSVDEILSVIVEDWHDVVRLDAHVTHPERADQAFKFELCSTVDELTQQLDRDPLDKPIFFYTQPQSLHIRLLAGDELPSSGGRRFVTKPFFEPAATTLKRLDACFGNLIQYLKRRGLYEDSIVVLTSDHGDSYGEGGRWGHAFYVAPEILHIPLIIRVPDALRQSLRWNPDALALLTDLTPTLYGLLGYQVLPPTDLVGRPFLTARDAPEAPGRDMVLVEGSYSRVFGLLDGRARWMYTADANHTREELFAIEDDGKAENRTLTRADRLPYRKWLLERLSELNRFYAR
jgi:arylsulfatase A-like enzyme